MALKRVWIPSPNYSSRGGATPRLIVLHTAEGALSYSSLGSYFASSSSGVSSQVGIDDTPGVVGEYVARGNKAWTQGNANPVAVSAELCAFAAWDAATWNVHSVMLENCALWVAEEAAALGIPIVRLTPAQAQGSGRGVCQHVDLGSWGGGHTDCGPAFPMDRVLAMAGGSHAPAPSPSPPSDGGFMFLAYATNDSPNDPSVKKNYQYVIKENGTAIIATPADSNALAAKLGPAVGLSGNQIAAFK